MFTVIYHPQAEQELIDAARFYNKKVPGLGLDFLQEVEKSVATILQDPFCWRIVENDVRRYVTKRFPYAIFYRIELDKVRILAVKHHSRNPDYWKHRKKT